jgi:soluble lytic murein transglycosylase-like protein
MKKYWKSIAQSGVLALSVTALVVATQSGTAKEVHDASNSPKQETISYDSFMIDNRMDLFIQKQQKLAMQNQNEQGKKQTKAVTMETKVSHVQIAKAEPAKEVKKEPEVKRTALPTPTPQPKSQPKSQPKPQPTPNPQPKPQPQPQPQPKPTPQPQQSDSFYIKSLPMPYEQQKYLYDMAKKRGLDYKETLAFIGHESEFNSHAKGGSNYGYFQINSVNHSHLSRTLGTKVAPFDPYVNINWGTYMLSELYKKYHNKNAVLSAYNKGEGGYAKTGLATAYIQKHNQVLAQINSMK